MRWARLMGDDGVPPEDMRHDLRKCKQMWATCLQKVARSKQDAACAKAVAPVQAALVTFKDRLVKCLWHKEQLDLATVDPALWLSEENMEHCEESARWKMAAKECKHKATMAYRLFVARVMAQHAPCLRYPESSPSLVHLDTSCLPSKLLKDLSTKREAALSRRSFCESKIAACFGKDRAAVALARSKEDQGPQANGILPIDRHRVRMAASWMALRR
eukprot:g6895.t1